MQLTSALVVFAVLWFLTLFIVLPLRNKSQGEAGEVEPGTHASAPADPQMGRKFRLTTIIAFCLWVPICIAIHFGWVTVEMINLYDWANPS